MVLVSDASTEKAGAALAVRVGEWVSGVSESNFNKFY